MLKNGSSLQINLFCNLQVIPFDNFFIFCYNNDGDKMKIIISPAKKMKQVDNDYFNTSKPAFLNEALALANEIKTYSITDIQTKFKCNRKIAVETYDRYQNLTTTSNLSPAILSFNGIQYTNMAPNVFTDSEIEYINQHLYILSGLYGILKPLDEISLYRLDLDNDFEIASSSNLYDFWNDKIYTYLYQEDDVVINLSSNEYTKLISKYLRKKDTFIDVYFYQDTGGKLVETPVYVKQARGRMVRYLANIKASKFEDIIHFNDLGYIYSKELSTDKKIIFVRKAPKHVTNK